MPWLLDTPIPTGDLDPNGPYTHIRIRLRDNDPDRKVMIIVINYGTWDGSTFTDGTIPINKPMEHNIVGDKYTTLVTTHEPNPGEKTYEASKRGLYEHLNTEGVIDDGSVV